MGISAEVYHDRKSRLILRNSRLEWRRKGTNESLGEGGSSREPPDDVLMSCCLKQE